MSCLFCSDLGEGNPFKTYCDDLDGGGDGDGDVDAEVTLFFIFLLIGCY